jgi:phosphoserine/homoserine phosphotransferase
VTVEAPGAEAVKTLISAAGTKAMGDETLYQFNVKLHAKQMNDLVTVKVFTGEDQPVVLFSRATGEDVTETGFQVTIQDYIQKTIATIDPLPGAKEFMDTLRSETQVIILSDTFEQFASPLMKKLGWPTIFCNTLEVGENGEITGYKIRVPQSKLSTVKALQSVGFETIASGDSYNDLAMIQASKAGFLFRTTEKIRADYPDLPAFESYDDLLQAIRGAL